MIVTLPPEEASATRISAMTGESPSQPPIKGGMASLYANLLDPGSSDSASISRAPVVFKQSSPEEGQQEAVKKQQSNAAKFSKTTTDYPEIKGENGLKAPQAQESSQTPNAALQTRPSANVAAAKNNLSQWTSIGEDEDVNGFYAGEKRQRGGRKKRKKNKEESAVPQNWDDIYDPSRPNNFEEYKHSDEKIREIRDWKDRLYAHRIVRREQNDAADSDSDNDHTARNRQYAPPAAYSFGPPPSLSNPMDQAKTLVQDPDISEAPTGEDAYARRMRLSQQQQAPSAPLPPPQNMPSSANIDQTSVSRTISKAPVRYNLPAAPTELPASELELAEQLKREEEDDQDLRAKEDDAPRSLRPGQKGFAERLMSKYGWTKGSGLGADGSGIINPLRAKVEKQKKKSDAEGGGFVGPGGRGKIIGGKKKDLGSGEGEEGKFGAMSEVIVLQGMVDGMDLDQEISDTGSGGLMQEIGEECSEKYGRVERVFIHRLSPDRAKVFVKFTSQLSALRAVNALEGRVFNGNNIGARFYSLEKFEQGDYE